MNHKSTALLGALLVALPVLAGDAVTVTQKGLRFSESELTVDKGQAVTFVNDDSTAHNITVSGEGVSINGGLQAPGASTRIPFSKPGTYAVSCGIHPKMKMTVTVK